MLSILLTKNHKYIKECARNICRRKDERMADDLISEVYLKVNKFETLPTKDDEFIKVFVTNMKYEFIGRRSKFNKLYTPKELELAEGIQIADTDSDIELYIQCEQTNESTKALINELSHLKEEQAQSYINVMEFKDSLPGWEKEVFEGYFELDKSGRLIARESSERYGYNMSKQRVQKLINIVKHKLEVWQSLTL